MAIRLVTPAIRRAAVPVMKMPAQDIQAQQTVLPTAHRPHRAKKAQAQFINARLVTMGGMSVAAAVLKTPAPDLTVRVR